MPRILFVSSTPFVPWRGASHRVRHDLAALVALGHTVDLLTPPGSAVPEMPGVQSLSTPHLPFCRNLPPGPSLRRFATDVVMAAKAVAACNRHAYTLMHGIDDGGVVAGIAGRLTKTPWVFERTGDFVPNRSRGLNPFWHTLHRFLERRALRRAAAVIGNDTGMIELFSRLNCRSRACVIPDIPAIDEEISPSVHNLAMARYRTERNQKLVTCVGSYSRFQGLDLFFNAMPHVLATRPNVRFVVVGGDAAGSRMTQAQPRRYRRVGLFPGRIGTEELAAPLSISDASSRRRAGTTAPIKVLITSSPARRLSRRHSCKLRHPLRRECRHHAPDLTEFAVALLAQPRVWVLNSGGGRNLCGAGAHARFPASVAHVMTTSFNH